ncbi:MAG: hypothetical protein IJI53_11880 [Clostridia bacterium]|nr:hypothetical protein [Clostridia bacterium]
MAERENKDNRLKMAYNKKSRVCRGGYDPPALSNDMQAMKMLIAAIRFFRADDIRPYNDRNCSWPRNYFGTELQRVIALAGKE